MASRGLFFGEGPSACPFVALESDRDRRSDEPDHRHRCYAEPEPAPRALAHQREYCLAAAFTTCPIFQDWAIRAAATPVPLRQSRLPDKPRDAEPAWAVAPAWLQDGSAPEEAAGGAPDGAPDGGPDFVEPPAREAASDAQPTVRIERVPSKSPDEAREGQDAAPPPPRRPQSLTGLGAEPAPREPTFDAPSAVRREPEPSGHDAAPPPFLADRADRADQSAATSSSRETVRAFRPSSEKLRPEDVVPTWGRQPLPGYGARSKVSYGDSASWLSRLTTLLAIGVIIALAVAAIILAPSLLGGGGDPQRTLPAAGASGSPGQATPTRRPTPTPAPSLQTYTIQPGDTLFSIALDHGLTVDQLLLANPEITNPDLVQIGQVLLIPEDDFGLFSPQPPTPRPSPSPTASP
ncbi:MAG TPA: LysM peptidoglycan-binding domain-containing protein [Candidatus Limnocylindria bacterium]|nr:LysM peptidoglycan-binding domain-containing protein [Candidatus Limnocylindria bacterium]